MKALSDAQFECLVFAAQYHNSKYEDRFTDWEFATSPSLRGTWPRSDTPKRACVALTRAGLLDDPGNWGRFRITESGTQALMIETERRSHLPPRRSVNARLNDQIEARRLKQSGQNDDSTH